MREYGAPVAMVVIELLCSSESSVSKILGNVIKQYKFLVKLSPKSDK
jgi:hypothetical protein